jgi:hypothetical protein
MCCLSKRRNPLSSKFTNIAQEQSQLMPLAELLEHPWLNSRKCLSFLKTADRLSVLGVTLSHAWGVLYVAALSSFLLSQSIFVFAIACHVLVHITTLFIVHVRHTWVEGQWLEQVDRIEATKLEKSRSNFKTEMHMCLCHVCVHVFATSAKEDGHVVLQLKLFCTALQTTIS